MDILSGRKTTGDVEGDVRFGGGVPTRAFLQRYTGFVEQFDTLIGTLTVEEMLMYTAYLKRPVAEGRDAKQRAVDELLDQLGLVSCKDVKIGDNMQKGISGGQVRAFLASLNAAFMLVLGCPLTFDCLAAGPQAKRVNIGIALITNPKVLFLDEPTSGLDSHT